MIKPFEKIQFPIVRAAQPLFAKSLVSIQPMTVPSGGIFYIDYTYDKKRYTVEEWKQVYFNGEKACFDWEQDDGEWVMKLPSGVIVAAIREEKYPHDSGWSCTFYPTGAFTTKIKDLEELKQE